MTNKNTEKNVTNTYANIRLKKILADKLIYKVLPVVTSSDPGQMFPDLDNLGGLWERNKSKTRCNNNCSGKLVHRMDFCQECLDTVYEDSRSTLVQVVVR